MTQLADLTTRYAGLEGAALIEGLIRDGHAGRIAVVSSFGAEAALLLALVAQVDPATPVLFLDTAKHFKETLVYREQLTQQLGLTDVRSISPDADELAAQDPSGTLWSSDPDACCRLRKVLPLERALAGFDVWLTGRKRHQAETRADLPVFEAVDGGIRVNPLAGWTPERIAAEFIVRDLPPHPLVALGFPSIGCAPCTTGVLPGEDIRSGRWAGQDKTECGIHWPLENQVESRPSMTPLDRLESDSIYILREAFRRVRPLALLWSLGKDSNVMLWLARKAFLGQLPMPVLHVDTGRKFPEMYAFRDRYAAEWGLDLLVEPCPPIESVDPTLPPSARSAARKTEGLKAAIAKHGLAGVVAGIRRDEQATRAKERVFSPRGADQSWDVRRQPPEIWDQFATDRPVGGHLRVHPLLQWTELDVWRYIEREGIPVVDLYFTRDGQRYRSLGDQDITFPVPSTASSIAEILRELEVTQTAERAGRAMDDETEDAFERLRVGGYL